MRIAQAPIGNGTAGWAGPGLV